MLTGNTLARRVTVILTVLRTSRIIHSSYKKLREKLDYQGNIDGKHYIVTIAGAASSTFAQNTELALLAKYTDYINIMTYDLSGSWCPATAHHTNLYNSAMSSNWGTSVSTAVNLYTKNGVPVDKIVLGAAFYGYSFGGVASTVNNGLGQSYTGSVATLTYNQLAAGYINLNGYTRYWDDAAKAPYLFNPSLKTFITYEDTESIGYKTAYIKTKGLAGAMFWEYMQDSSGALVDKLYGDLK